MLYAVVFAAVSLYCLTMALVQGDWTLILIWPAVSFGVVSYAYAFNEPGVFGKTTGGRLTTLNLILLLPYLLMVWTFWHLLRILKSESAHNQINDGLTIGRRVFPNELPANIDAVVDLTAEHPEPKLIREGAVYIAHPILDNHIPNAAELNALVERIYQLGHLYVHCAEGHGRAALVSACVLLKRGEAKTPDEAVKMLQAERPLVRPRGGQRKALRQFAATLSE